MNGGNGKIRLGMSAMSTSVGAALELVSPG